MKELSAARMTPRGRIAKWSKEQLEKLSTIELRALLGNAERLKEIEVATLCTEILTARPRGMVLARRSWRRGEARRLVSRGRAFEIHGVSLRSRNWSRGGIRTDGAVLLAVRADEVQKGGATSSTLLWAPNLADAHPWSDTPGGQERLEHCRMAIEHGAAEGLMAYPGQAGSAPAESKSTRAERIDADNVLKLQVEKRGEEYWATWAPPRRVVVNTFE